MLKAFYKDSSEIPEENAADYKQNNEGLYVLQVEARDGWALENVSGLKSAHLKTKGKLDEARNIVNGLPEGFTTEQYIKDKAKFAESGNFNIEEERRDLKVEIQKQEQNNYKGIIERKDAELLSFKTSVEQSARNEIFGKCEALGIDKMLIESYVNNITKVDIGEGGYNLGFINADGSKMQKAEDNGDIRDYNTSDFIADLPEHKVYGKLVQSQANSGNGGRKEYSNSPQQGVKYVSEAESGNYLKEISEGKVFVR